MSIEISTQIIHNSFAQVINQIDAKANIYDNPNQQGTVYPAWFIVHRSPVEVMRDFGKRYGGNRYQLTYQIDIWYMIQQNIPRLYDQYASIAEQLDEKLEYLPIFGSDAVVHVYDKSWSLELNAMKYSTTLRLRVSRLNADYFNESTMDVITTEVFLKMQNEAILAFTNTSHPEFDAQLPNPISVTKGQYVNLPSVSGEFEDEDFIWIPNGWTVGAFGARVQLTQNTVADLLWRYEEKTAALSFVNDSHPEFEVELPDTIVANKGTAVVLPMVEGSFPEGIKIWQPSAWDIGAFGDEYTLNADTIAHLLFAEGPSDIIMLWAKVTDSNNRMYYQQSATYSSSPINNRLYELYTDEELTQRFVINPDKAYERGTVENNVWIPSEIQNISDMPGSATSVFENSKSGFLIYYNGSSQLWAVTNYSLSLWTLTENNKLSTLFKVKSMPEVSGIKAYFTTNGQMEMNDESVGNSGYKLYNANGTQVTADYSHTYTIVDMIKRDGTHSENIERCSLRVEYGKLYISGSSAGSVSAYCVVYTIT